MPAANPVPAANLFGANPDHGGGDGGDGGDDNHHRNMRGHAHKVIYVWPNEDRETHQITGTDVWLSRDPRGIDSIDLFH